MSRLAVCDQSGKISRIIDVPDFMDDDQAGTLTAGEQIVAAPEWADLRNAYVSGGVVLERQALNLATPAPITANDQDEAVIASIPSGVSVTCNGETQEVVDGKVEFSTDMPGTYRLKFTAVEYLDQEVVIEAVPAD